jgi:hypothetical protein
MTHDPTRDCEHGRLKGKCDVCDLQAEVERLNRVNAELVEALNQLVKAEQRAKDLSMFADTYAAESVSFQIYDAMKAARAALAKATGETK